jgi:nuclease S1
MVLVLALMSPVLAWNSEGHVLVTEIAWEQLSEPCRRRVVELLRSHPDGAVTTLAQAGVWPDQVRDPSHPFRVHHRQDWHYVDRLIQPPTPGVELKLGGQLLQQLERQVTILGDSNRTRAERALALSWIAHLVGDIHQPLHNSELYDQNFPQGDQGGNRFEVVLGQKPVSLHRLWDSAGGRFLDPPTTQRLKSYGDWFQQAYPPDFFGEALQDLSFHTWSDEGLSLAKQAYATVRLGQPLEREALQQILDTSERRITLAGYRLAFLLERVLLQDR